MAKPKRTFTGQEGQRSTGTAGPDAIRRDFDAAFAMFDPNAILPDGDAGGIGAENMKPGAATDEVIGDRTINDSTTPSSDTGKLTTLLSNLANRIRAIMGTSSWRSGPPTTLQAAKDHIDAPAPHSGHETPAGAQAKVDAHANRRDNPHGVTKAQVGLGNVENYGIATQAEAEAGSVNNKYMTPLRVAQAIAALHANRQDNPHGVTKAQVGLGNVENYGIATQAEAEAGSVNNKYMTPLRVAQAIAALHANRRDNPHQVTAAQVGAITSVAGISNPGGGVDIVAGSAISITKDTTNKRIIINAHTEGAAPGPHASTHASGGSDPITPAMIGAETPSGAQAKADAAKAAVQADLDSHKADGGAHGATSAATPNAIIRRDSAGRAKVAAPSASDDIARKAEVDAVSSALNTHKSSGDHDGRYYTKSQLDTIINTHKSSGDHDERYYTKSQLDTIIRNLLLNYWFVSPSGTSNALNGVAYGNGLSVAVGATGTILTSENGTSWTSRTSSTPFALQGVTYANGFWVVVGDRGTILTSENGTSWTPRTSGTTSPLWGVAYGNGLLVAVGTGGMILTSPDGTSWTSRSSGTSNTLNDVAYGNGLWVAVGDNGTILTSTNGTSWTLRTSGTSEHLLGVAYGNGFWVVVGSSGTILTSTNGTSWTSRDSGTQSHLLSVAYADGFLVVVGASGTILTSTNGTLWAPRDSGTTSILRGVAYGNGFWVAVGDSGTISTSRVIFS